jgi:glycosyltransferase involved in cell wall biosynthesis
VIPNLSVIVPTVGRSSLNRAIHSITSQVNVVLEIIIVDDSELQDLSFPENVPGRIIKTGGKVGVSQARNIGLNAATNRWVAFLDDDDEWLPNKSEVQLKYMKELSLDASLTSAFVNKITRPKVLLKIDESPIHALYSRLSFFANRHYMAMGSLIYDSEKFQIRFMDKLAERENIFFYESLFKLGAKIGQIDEPLVIVHFSKSNSLGRINLKSEIEWFGLISNYPKHVRRNFLIESGRNFARDWDFGNAIKVIGVLLRNEVSKKV